MGKTDIEWCNFSINPVKGLCPVGCSYCYALLDIKQGLMVK